MTNFRSNRKRDGSAAAPCSDRQAIKTGGIPQIDSKSKVSSAA